MSRTRGRFITFEGVEGAGKSTVIREIADWLQQQGQDTELTREPGGTPLAEQIREVLLGKAAPDMPPDCELLLMFAARSAHVHGRIEPALNAGRWVLCDRFVDASRAYQGAGRGLDTDWIEQLVERIAGPCQPDRVLILDLPVEQGLERVRGRGDMNRFDRESLAFMERVRQAYLALAAREPARYRVIAAGEPLAQVVAAARSALEDLA